MRMAINSTNPFEMSDMGRLHSEGRFEEKELGLYSSVEVSCSFFQVKKITIMPRPVTAQTWRSPKQEKI